MSGGATQHKVERNKITLQRSRVEGVFSIEYDGEYVGSGQLLTTDKTYHESQEQCPKQCVRLVNFNIVEDFRNSGLGTDLLQYIIEIAKLIDIGVICLTASHESASFFKRFGFVSEHNDEEFVLELKDH